MKTWRRRIFRNGLRIFALGYVVFLVGMPIGSVVYHALKPGLSSVWDQITTPDGLHALQVTMLTGVIAVICNTLFGLGVALILTRHRFRGVAILEAVVDLPLAISPVVVGLALVLFYSSREGWIGPWLASHGILIIFSFPGIVLAAAFVSLPYVVREVSPVLQEIGTDQEQAAETLGAGPFTVFFRITLPAIRWGLAYGVLLTSARILGEFGAMSVVSGNITGDTQTFTQYVDTDFINFNSAGAYAGALLLALISLALLGALSISRSKEGIAQ